MSVQQTALLGWGRVFKRGFDIIVSLIALIILSPLFLIVAIINKMVLGKYFSTKHGSLAAISHSNCINFKRLSMIIMVSPPKKAFARWVDQT